MSSSYTMRLLKCPACGGPMDPPGGESSMKCPYCGNLVAIPDSLRKPDPNQQQQQGSLFSGADYGSLMGYGAQWSEVVMMAQNGQKDAAVKKYMSFSNVSESDAKAMVNSLAGAQTYEFTPGTGYNSVQIAPIIASTSPSTSGFSETSCAMIWTSFL